MSVRLHVALSRHRLPTHKASCVVIHKENSSSLKMLTTKCGSSGVASLLCVVAHILWFGVTTTICSLSVVARMPRSMGGWRAAKTEVSQTCCHRCLMALTCRRRRAQLIFLVLLLRTSHPGTSSSVGKDGDAQMDLWKYFTFHQLVAPSCHFRFGHTGFF